MKICGSNLNSSLMTSPIGYVHVALLLITGRFYDTLSLILSLGRKYVFHPILCWTSNGKNVSRAPSALCLRWNPQTAQQLANFFKYFPNFITTPWNVLPARLMHRVPCFDCDSAENLA